MMTLVKRHTFDEVFDSQRVFRLLLEAMSNPPRIVNIQEYADKLQAPPSVFLAIAVTLLDSEVSFYAGNDPRLADEIVSLTLAKRATLPTADFIFVSDAGALARVFQEAKCGAPADPHRSATLIVRDDGDRDCEITLRGPGIDGQTAAFVSERVKTALQTRDLQCYEYPQGVDVLFVTDAGAVWAAPRLLRWEVR
jgi:alpha-D-ribose 1-methylphosphonate 5-triphosphate synthase subunit PhnH